MKQDRSKGTRVGYPQCLTLTLTPIYSGDDHIFYLSIHVDVQTDNGQTYCV